MKDFLSSFDSDVASVSPVLNNGDSFEVDQFQGSDFFRSSDGAPLRDYQVFAKSEKDPVLREKMQKYMIENDINGFGSDVSDDEIFDRVVSRFDSNVGLLDRVKLAIARLRSKSVPPESTTESVTTESTSESFTTE